MRSRATIVIATRNRAPSLITTLERLRQLPGGFPIIVADNDSRDGTPGLVRALYPHVCVIALRRNFGAYARTLAAGYVKTEYIAFCDDDTWWTPGAIDEAVETLDSHPSVAVINAKVVLDPSGVVDEACRRMGQTPALNDLPGHPILFFQAGAAVIRTRAFLQCGGYQRAFFIGGEETLLSIDLARRGWLLLYLPSIVVRHAPSPMARDAASRRRRTIRNRLLVAWMRYRFGSARRVTATALGLARDDCCVRSALLQAVARAHWALLRRHPIDGSLQHRIDALELPTFE